MNQKKQKEKLTYPAVCPELSDSEGEYLEVAVEADISNVRCSSADPSRPLAV